MTSKELLAQGYKFYKEFKGLDYTNGDKNRSRNIKRNLEGVYEYVVQKQKKVKGQIIQEAGIWIKEEGVIIFADVCKTKKSMNGFDKLLDFYLSNHVDYLTVKEIAILTGTNNALIEAFEKHCRITGIMEKQQKPSYREIYNKYTGKIEKIAEDRMTQYYYISYNGQTGKHPITKEFYKQYYKKIYKRADYLANEFLKNNPQYSFVTSDVYKGFVKQAKAEFNKADGFKVCKGNTRKINLETLYEMGIEKEYTVEPLESVLDITRPQSYDLVEIDTKNSKEKTEHSDIIYVTYEEYMDNIGESEYYSRMIELDMQWAV